MSVTNIEPLSTSIPLPETIIPFQNWIRVHESPREKKISNQESLFYLFNKNTSQIHKGGSSRYSVPHLEFKTK